MLPKRAVLSVYDKRGLAPFASRLSSMGVELFSSGGTAGYLKESGIPVAEVTELTGFPELLDGRVKTLHPAVHAAILSRRERPDDAESLAEHGIVPIDLVAVNLYPFSQMLDAGLSEREMSEYIDIGGPCMLRAAAKNYRDVIVLCDPADYAPVAGELEQQKGLDLSHRRRLAAKVFDLCSDYDRCITSWLKNN